MGKDKTGYSVPFAEAFEIIAAIIVEEIAMPTLPSKNAKVKSKKFFITNDSNKIENKNVIAIFIKKTSSKLKISLPEKIVEGEAIRCSVIVVPRSSSDTNARESPDIAEKKITTHKSPPVKKGDIFSLPTENIITLIVTSMNIASAFIA